MTEKTGGKDYKHPKIVKRTREGKLKSIPPISKKTFESLVIDLNSKTAEAPTNNPPLAAEIKKFRASRDKSKKDQRFTLNTIFSSLSDKPLLTEVPSPSFPKKINQEPQIQYPKEYEEKLKAIQEFQNRFASEIKGISIERQIFPPFHKIIVEIKSLLENSYSKNQDTQKQTEELPKQIQEISLKIKFISNQLDKRNLDQDKAALLKKLLQKIIDFIQSDKDQEDLDKIEIIEMQEEPIAIKETTNIPEKIMEIAPLYKSPEENIGNNISEIIDMIEKFKPTEAEIGRQELEEIKKIFEETKLQLIESVNRKNMQESVENIIKLLIQYCKKIIQKNINNYSEVSEKISQKLTEMANLTTEIGLLKKINTQEAQEKREKLINIQNEHKEILEILERQKNSFNFYKKFKKLLTKLEKKLEI